MAKGFTHIRDESLRAKAVAAYEERVTAGQLAASEFERMPPDKTGSRRVAREAYDSRINAATARFERELDRIHAADDAKTKGQH
ncbi:MAG: hypothetical protein ACRDUA_19575 [Micromonosporaceae bacterium]